mmetsp:Transcript_17733/g.29051  ORF Transcript_17733/g.29051 Transcript_17733/m.29051 type:complete len:204 (+) Transcript_17733:470-1081(+)
MWPCGVKRNRWRATRAVLRFRTTSSNQSSIEHKKTTHWTLFVRHGTYQPWGAFCPQHTHAWWCCSNIPKHSTGVHITIGYCATNSETIKQQPTIPIHMENATLEHGLLKSQHRNRNLLRFSGSCWRTGASWLDGVCRGDGRNLVRLQRPSMFLDVVPQSILGYELCIVLSNRFWGVPIRQCLWRERVGWGFCASWRSGRRGCG